MAAKTTGKILRVGIMHSGRIIEDRYFRKPETITVGESPKSTFILPLSDVPIPKCFPLFQFKGDHYQLNVTESVSGKISDGAAVSDLRQLISSGRAKPQGKGYALAMRESMKGTVKVGDITVIFHFVQAPPLPAKPKLPASIRGGWIKSIDWVYLSILLCSFVLHSGILSYASTQPIPKVSNFEQMSERFAKFVVQELPEPEKEDLPDEGEGLNAKKKKEDKKAEADKEDKPKKELSAREKAEAAARRKAEIAKKVAGAGLVNFLTSKGPNSGDSMTALADTLAEGGRFGDIDGTMQGVSGLGIATKATERGRRGGGGGGPKSKEISRMGVGEGGRAGLAGREEKKIKGSTKLGSLEVDGALDSASIKRIVKRNLPSIRHCYEQQLRRNPKLSGKVTIEVTVASNGVVTNVEVIGSSLNDRSVESCIISTVRRWRFPKPEGGEVIFSHPFIFEPVR